MVIQAVYNYAIHLLLGLGMVGLFVAIYVRITPLKEIALIQQGCTAATLSLGGATLGFTLTVASSILHSDTLMMFTIWSLLALLVQLLTYLLMARVLPRLATELACNNVAMGALMGTLALVVGIINAACLS